MGSELEPLGTEGEDYFVVRRGGREIVVPIRKHLPDGSMEPYSENPQVRAYQLVHEKKIGGARNGNGSGQRRKRISKAVVEEAQERLQPRIIRVLERGLNRSAGIKQNLATVKLITDMEHHEASLELKEEELDLTKADRSELIGTLRALLEDPATEAALEGVWEGTYEDITEAEVAPNGLEGEVHHGRGSGSNGDAASDEGTTAGGTGPTGASSSEAAANGSDTREAADDGRGAPSSDRAKRRNPWVTAAKGGAKH